MVASSRTTTSPDRVRPLNLPRPIEVTLDEQSGLPRILHERNGPREIERIQDAWQVDDEWWREPIRRRYLQIVLRDGALRTIFHDQVSHRWFEQAY
jgi:hypothetical protein